MRAHLNLPFEDFLAVQGNKSARGPAICSVLVVVESAISQDSWIACRHAGFGDRRAEKTVNLPRTRSTIPKCSAALISVIKLPS